MPDWLAAFLSHDASPAVQFLKYAIAGGIATGVHVLVFFLAGFLLFPCVTKDDILVRIFRLRAPDVDEALRARRALYCNLLAFFLSNLVCYVINRLFVFLPSGRPVLLEFALFLGVSAISMSIGVSLMTFLIRRFRVQTTWAFSANILASLLVNYALRKFFVFAG